jgi:hypothetical protein
MKETYTQLVPTPARRHMNTGLKAARVSTLIEIFGPFPDLPVNCSGENKNKTVRGLLETRNVGPFRVTGIAPALDSLARIFARVKADHPDLYKIVGTAGMHCYRRVRGGASPSNHSAGTAIDITIGGVLPPMDFTPETPNLIPNGFVVLYGYFHREGWFWGAGYAGDRVDAMHYEASDSLLRAWRNNGWKTPVKKAPAAPRLFLNGRQIEGAYLVAGNWYVMEGNVAPILGAMTQTPTTVAPLAALLSRWGWKVEKYTGRLAARNRVDIRVARSRAGRGSENCKREL